LYLQVHPFGLIGEWDIRPKAFALLNDALDESFFLHSDGGFENVLHCGLDVAETLQTVDFGWFAMRHHEPNERNKHRNGDFGAMREFVDSVFGQVVRQMIIVKVVLTRHSSV